MRVTPPPLQGHGGRRAAARADEARALAARTVELLSVIDQLCLTPRPDRSR
ncbi:MAG: hypothetical protein AVDCRST_MAG76-1338 [uncultured Acidimicrobiales bacterium]|uniref:Uncharacterized protein n=1 Tax=uncultured Acidimicrobiales bacterium TaxID=310071 RepID=A0A6J4HUM2_9ACTN|nr:MAG: hypothetical protein AVDCRST_MAG76-1338 [uncultured Acidimicrobiales bacterium]